MFISHSCCPKSLEKRQRCAPGKLPLGGQQRGRSARQIKPNAYLHPDTSGRLPSPARANRPSSGCTLAWRLRRHSINASQDVANIMLTHRCIGEAICNVCCIGKTDCHNPNDVFVLFCITGQCASSPTRRRRDLEKTLDVTLMTQMTSSSAEQVWSEAGPISVLCGSGAWRQV